MTATAKQFLTALASQIGYREGRDPDGNWNNDNKFGRWYGMNYVAWCAIFQSWGANEVGALGTLVPKYASCTAGLNWFRAREQTGVWPPRPGDIFILLEYAPTRWNAQANGWAPIHTGAVEKFVADAGNPDAGFIVTIEGNTNLGGSDQGNGVYRLQRRDTKTSNAIIYCRPSWAPEPPPTIPTSGGDSAVVHPKPSPAKPKPIPGATYTGSRTIDVSSVRPNRRNEASRRFNGLMWAWLCRNSPTYARKNASAWMRESSNLYGPQAQRATQEMYRVLSARQPKRFRPVKLPTWPGPEGVAAIGGKPV
jgi:hypothetical protein